MREVRFSMENTSRVDFGGGFYMASNMLDLSAFGSFGWNEEWVLLS